MRKDKSLTDYINQEKTKPIEPDLGSALLKEIASQPKDESDWKPERYDGFWQRQERQWAMDVAGIVANREKREMRTVRADLLDSFRIREEDINKALELEFIFELKDGSLTCLPQWARVDSNAPSETGFPTSTDPLEDMLYSNGRDEQEASASLDGSSKPLALYSADEDSFIKAKDDDSDNAFVFAGLKLKNADRAAKDGYWFYTGTETDVLKAQEELFAIGASAKAEPNGKTEKKSWRLIYDYEYNLRRISEAVNRLKLMNDGEDLDLDVWQGDIKDCIRLARFYSLNSTCFKKITVSMLEGRGNLILEY